MYFVFAVIALCSSAFANSDDYTVGAGDILDIELYGEDISGAYQVSSTGTISFPHVGEVEVGGLTPFAAEQALRQKLLAGYYIDPQLSVRVKEYRSQRIEVVGAVKEPGLYYLEGATTVRAITAKAGGVVSERSNGRVVLTKTTGKQIVLPLHELDGPGGDILLAAGDIVDVDEGAVVYVGGQVENPGTVGFIDGLTVSQALHRAGGPTQLARLSGAYLLRGGDKLSINLKRVLKGKEPDITMEPGDQLVIQESHL